MSSINFAGHQIVVQLDFSTDGTSLANHKAKRSNNPQNNSGLCQYVISVPKTSAVHMKIIGTLKGVRHGFLSYFDHRQNYL